MKRKIMVTAAALAILLLIVFGCAKKAAAEDGVPAAPPVIAPITSPASTDITWPGLNLSGDTGYLHKVGFCAGIGTDLVSFKQDLITLRAELLWPKNTTSDATHIIGGAGLMLDIVKALGYTKAQWKLGPIQPKLGPFAGEDFSNKVFAWGGILQVIRAPF